MSYKGGYTFYNGCAVYEVDDWKLIHGGDAGVAGVITIRIKGQITEKRMMKAYEVKKVKEHSMLLPPTYIFVLCKGQIPKLLDIVKGTKPHTYTPMHPGSVDDYAAIDPYPAPYTGDYLSPSMNGGWIVPNKKGKK